MSQRQYFGTDGIRGRVGETPITADFALRLGRAIGTVLGAGNASTVVIGKDTRLSGYMFESALEAGLAAAGSNVKLLGPMPTPAIAYLTRTLRASAGIVISASHNPHYDNGFKFFSNLGEKLPDTVEEAIEAELSKPFTTVAAERLGKAMRIDDAEGRYIEFVKNTLHQETTFRGLKVVLDCANGATYHVAPRVFRELDADVHVIGNQPDGYNINLDCGSTSLGALQKAVLDHGADLGIAFDGDGDRVLMVDDQGHIADGDDILYLLARSGQQTREWNGSGVVGTLMTNFGVEKALEKAAIPFVRAKVGDRYVHQELKQRGWHLGGEASGHIIDLRHTTTGDGLITALSVCEVLVRAQRGLRDTIGEFERYPQVMINVPVSGRPDLGKPEIQSAADSVTQRLGSEGRLILRPSGTEPLVRVTIEGRDNDLVTTLAEELADVVRKHA